LHIYLKGVIASFFGDINSLSNIAKTNTDSKESRESKSVTVNSTFENITNFVLGNVDKERLKIYLSI
jgi:hypothetical protein